MGLHKFRGFGNTSTDVEKTHLNSSALPLTQKHLHGRGEDNEQPDGGQIPSETPPRTWRRPLRQQPAHRSSGNTSTDVEKTSGVPEKGRRAWKHLHGRGEDWQRMAERYQLSETPPRTWRRPDKIKALSDKSRNTSTDVEETQNAVVVDVELLETPPRTWRRPTLLQKHKIRQGNTSTDMEKTKRIRHRAGQIQKHLHGRGEDTIQAQSNDGYRETPPRTWRRPAATRMHNPSEGNTSTDVEKTLCRRYW